MKRKKAAVMPASSNAVGAISRLLSTLRSPSKGGEEEDPEAEECEEGGGRRRGEERRGGRGKKKQNLQPGVEEKTQFE